MPEPQTGITWWAIASSFGGTIIGSLSGALVGFYLQKRGLKATIAQREEDRMEKRKALCFSLYVKMIRLCSDLQMLGRILHETLRRAKDAGKTGAPFQYVQPIVPLPDPVKFLSEEMAVILSLDVALFNEMGALDELHASTVALFRMYGERRTALLEPLGAEIGDDGFGVTTMTAEQKRRFDPRAYDLNYLITVMLERTDVDSKEAWAALEHLHAVLEKEFKTKLKLEFKEPPVGSPGPPKSG